MPSPPQERMVMTRVVDYVEGDRMMANVCLEDFGHKMGPYTRPNFGGERFNVLMQRGKFVGVTVSAPLVRETCAGFTRAEAIELVRVCAIRPDLCRVLVRLWREFVFPDYDQPWAVSYQDAVAHRGDLYRFDGWTIVGRSSSGTDPRKTVNGEPRKGRNKNIWGFTHDAAALAERRAAWATAAAAFAKMGRQGKLDAMDLAP